MNASSDKLRSQASGWAGEPKAEGPSRLRHSGSPPTWVVSRTLSTPCFAPNSRSASSFLCSTPTGFPTPSNPPPESIIRGAIGFVVRGSPAADETRARPHPFLQRNRLLEARDLFGHHPLARGQDYLPFARRRLRSLLERNDALAEKSLTRTSLCTADGVIALSSYWKQFLLELMPAERIAF